MFIHLSSFSKVEGISISCFRNKHVNNVCKKGTLSIIVCPSEKETSTRDAAMWLSCKILNCEKRSTDRSNFKDDKLENSDIRIPLKSSLFNVQRVPAVTARTDAWSGLLYLFFNMNKLIVNRKGCDGLPHSSEICKIDRKRRSSISLALSRVKHTNKYIPSFYKFFIRLCIF